MKLILLTILSLCMSAIPAIVQAQCFAYEQANISYITVKNGLPHNCVNDIFADSNGFLWLATYGGGLVRYDGYGFVLPGYEGLSLQMSSNSCKSVTEDRFKRLWVSFDECTSVLDLRTMHSVTPNSTDVDVKKILASRSVRVHCDAKGKIWLVTRSYIYHFDFDENGNIVHVAHYKYTSNTPDVRIKDVYGDGSVWASVDGGVYRLVCEQGKIIRKNISPVLKNIHAAFITDYIRRHGYIWIATNVGLYRFRLSDSTLKYYTHDVSNASLSHEYVSSIAVSADDKILLGTLCGINIYDDASDSFIHWDTHSLINPLNSDFVHCVFSWKGLLFVGTETGGVVKLSPRQLALENIVHDSSPQSLSPNCVNAMYTEGNGTLWVGTVEGGLNRRAAGESAFRHYTSANSNLSHNSVSTLTADNRNRLWIGTWGGGVNFVDMHAPATIMRISIAPKFVPLLKFVGALAYDKYNDGLWIGSNDGLYFYNFKSEKIEEPFTDCHDVRGCIGSIVDKDANLWVGNVEGVRVINLKSRRAGQRYFLQHILKYKLDNPKSGVIEKITSFCQTSDGTLWLGSNGYGLYHRTVDQTGREHFKVYTTQDGLANNSVKGIVADRHGMLWITTNNGLSEFDPKDQLFTNFTEEDGLSSTQFYWNSAIRDARGVMYFGSEKGLTVMWGQNDKLMYRGKLSFTRLIVDNQDIMAGSSYIDKDITIADKISLNEGNKSFSIDFSALNYGSETQGVYSYRMKGFENDWIQLPAGQHSVRYTRLPSGSYTFEVKYSSSVGDPRDAVISVNVHVTPYFWKSWWFISLLLIALAAWGVYLYNKRVAELKRREAQKLLEPIEKVLKDSDDPEMLQVRIQSVLDNQRRYHESYSKSAEIDLGELMHKKDLKPFMDRVMEVMEHNYSNSEFSVTEFSGEMDMSSSLLNKKLTAEVGMPATQFIREYRLRLAKELLLKNPGNQNVADIAFRVGFNDPKYFTRCFTKLFGTSPSKVKL